MSNLDLLPQRLVFEGGGVKGIAYVGALEALERQNKLSEVKAVAGTSAGAITALLYSLGYTMDEVKDISMKIDFNSFKDSKWGILRNFWGFFNNYGWYRGKELENLFKKLIRDQGLDENITFAELHELIEQGGEKSKFTDPYIIATDLNSQQREVFSYESNSDTPIWLAVRASMSIPFYFQAPEIVINGEEHRYTDGGVLDNYAIQLFDWEKYVTPGSNSNSRCFNSRTWGFRVDSPEEIADLQDRTTSSPIKGFLGFAASVVNTVLSAQNERFSRNEKDIDRTIFCNSGRVSAIDFDLTHQQKLNLIENGKKAAEKFLAELGKIVKTNPVVYNRKQPETTILVFNNIVSSGKNATPKSTNPLENTDFSKGNGSSLPETNYTFSTPHNTTNKITSEKPNVTPVLRQRIKRRNSTSSIASSIT